MPVDQYVRFPSAGAASANPSVGINGTTAPTSSTEIGFIDGSGNEQGVSATNPLPTTVTSSVLPTGAATSANQVTQENTLTAIQANQTNGTQVSTISGNVTVVQPTGTNLHTVVDSSALPTGASTSALQTTGNTSLASILSDMTNGTQITQVSNFPATQPVSGTVAVSNFPATQPVSGTVTANQGTAGGSAWPVSISTVPLPTGAATSANQSTEITALQAIQANQTNGTQVTGITGTVPLPTGAATSTLQTTGNTSLASIVTNTTGLALSSQLPASLGAKTTASSVAVNIASDQVVSTVQSDSAVTGQAAQTATVNNILTATAGTAATSTDGYRSLSVQVVSTGTGGTYIFEGSNDNVNFQTLVVYNQSILTGTPISGAITASATSLIYILPVTTNYIRLRIATTITGGSIQAFSRLSPTSWNNPVTQVAQNTAANLLTTATIASGTVTAVTSITNALPTGTNVIGSVASNKGTFTDRSGLTSATPSTSTQVAASNASRKYFIIQNVSTSNTIWINFTTAANASQPSLELTPGASYVMESNYVNTEAINVLCTSASSPFSAKEG